MQVVVGECFVNVSDLQSAVSTPVRMCKPLLPPPDRARTRREVAEAASQDGGVSLYAQASGAGVPQHAGDDDTDAQPSGKDDPAASEFATASDGSSTSTDADPGNGVASASGSDGVDEKHVEEGGEEEPEHILGWLEFEVCSWLACHRHACRGSNRDVCTLRLMHAMALQVAVTFGTECNHKRM
jgi:hypothetical protein